MVVGVGLLLDACNSLQRSAIPIVAVVVTAAIVCEPSESWAADAHHTYHIAVPRLTVEPTPAGPCVNLSLD